MVYLLFILLVPIALGLFFGLRSSLRKNRRARLQTRPFPVAWESILGKNVPLYLKLPPDLQTQLKDLMKVFLAEKRFEGCGGLELTEEIKVTIAGEACILLLNRPSTFYPKLTSILVYPHAYVAQGASRDRLGAVEEKEQIRLGESWHQGMLVLAWDNVKKSAENIHDGHNVVLHEFAHQLDQEDGSSDGAPILDHSTSYKSWARHFSDEFNHLQQAALRGRPTLMDHYGATNPAEFFAVATETFFEKSVSMQDRLPDLYEELKNYYRLDPAAWR